MVTRRNHVRDFGSNGLNFVHEDVPVRHEAIRIRFVTRMNKDVDFIRFNQRDQVRYGRITFLSCGQTKESCICSWGYAYEAQSS